MQRYKIYATPLITIDKQRMFYNPTDDLLEIEIKQIKGDMEEKNESAEEISIRIANEFEEKLKKYFKENMDKIDTSNLKPFDIQKAKEGKPVCTRDGRKARIIAFDRKLFYRKVSYPILALVECSDGKDDVCAYNEKGKVLIEDGAEYKDDLMMLPEKKSGWVNVYYDNDASSHRGCRFIYDTK